MKRNLPLTEEQKQQIILLYGKYSCVEISKIVEGVTLNQVYDLRRRLNITQKQNPQFELNDMQFNYYWVVNLVTETSSQTVSLGVIIEKAMQKTNLNI